MAGIPQDAETVGKKIFPLSTTDFQPAGGQVWQEKQEQEQYQDPEQEQDIVFPAINFDGKWKKAKMSG